MRPASRRADSFIERAGEFKKARADFEAARQGNPSFADTKWANEAAREGLERLKSGAQSARIDKIEIVGAGIMSQNTKPKTLANKDISTGQTLVGDTELTTSTTTIPAKKGTRFGIVVNISGAQPDRETTIKVVWLYPRGTSIKNPDGGPAKLRDEYDDKRKIGENNAKFYWVMNEDYALVPGKWTVELWQDDRRLAQQSFTLVN